MVPAEPILVEFAAVPEYVAVARRVVEVVGARGGIRAVQLEELQIAVSEVCNRLVTAGRDSHGEHAFVRLRFWLEPESMVAEVGGNSACVQAALSDLLDEHFGSYLLHRLVDRVSRVETAGGVALRLEKHRNKE